MVSYNSSPDSLDQLVGPLKERRRHRQAEGLGGLQVDDQLELGRLFDGKVSGVGTSQNLVRLNGTAAEEIREIGPIGHEAACLGSLPECEYCGQPTREREIDDALMLTIEHWARQDDERAGMISRHRGECSLEVVGAPCLQPLQLHAQ